MDGNSQNISLEMDFMIDDYGIVYHLCADLW